jgi:hypothetical protein
MYLYTRLVWAYQLTRTNTIYSNTRYPRFCFMFRFKSRPQTAYTDRVFRGFSQSLPANSGIVPWIRLRPLPSTSSLTCHPFIQRYIIWVTEKASLINYKKQWQRCGFYNKYNIYVLFFLNTVKRRLVRKKHDVCWNQHRNNTKHNRKQCLWAFHSRYLLIIYSRTIHAVT